MSLLKRIQIQLLKTNVPVLSVVYSFNREIVIVVKNSDLFFSIRIIKDHFSLKYKILSCISGVDYLLPTYRFCVSYELLSVVWSSRIRVKVFLDEYGYIPSITRLYSCSNWFEREVWDMFGLYFENHPDLRRILSNYGFEGYPLRKDFPLSGFTELKYDYIQKKIVCESVSLSQEYRYFNFEKPW